MDVGNLDSLFQACHAPFIYRDLPGQSEVLLVCNWGGMSCLPILGIIGIDHRVALSPGRLQLESHHSRELRGCFEDTVCIRRVQHGN